MLSPPNLGPAVRACRPLAVPFRGLTYRASHLRWFHNFATTQPLFTSPGVVSRYVPPAGPAALYSALDSDTAYREANQNFFALLTAPGGAGQALADAGGLRPDPLVVLGVHVSVGLLLDLFNVSVRQHLAIAAEAELMTPWKGATNPTPTKELGQAVFADGLLEGILYPSVQNPGRRWVVLFRNRLLAASRVDFQGFHFASPPPAVTLPAARLP